MVSIMLQCGGRGGEEGIPLLGGVFKAGGCHVFIFILIRRGINFLVLEGVEGFCFVLSRRGRFKIHIYGMIFFKSGRARGYAGQSEGRFFL